MEAGEGKGLAGYRSYSCGILRPTKTGHLIIMFRQLENKIKTDKCASKETPIGMSRVKSVHNFYFLFSPVNYHSISVD